MPTFNAEIANESPYSFTLLGEHLPSAAWAVPSKKDVADKLTTIPPKTTVSMTFTSSYTQLSGALTFISTGRETPIFIQVAFASPIVGPPTLNARASSQPIALHDFISTTISARPAPDNSVIEGEGCYWTARSDAAKKAPVVTVFVQVDDSLASGAVSSPPESATGSAAERFVLMVENESPIEFRYDGDLLSPHGTSLPHTRVASRSLVEGNGGWASTISEIAIPSNSSGCWWYRGAGVDGSSYFLSLAVYTNSMGKTYFFASCGAPPADLAAEFSGITRKESQKVTKSKLNCAPIACDGCEWVTTQRGSGVNTVVALKIAPELNPYNALHYPISADAEKSSEAASETLSAPVITESSSSSPAPLVPQPAPASSLSSDSTAAAHDSRPPETNAQNFMDSTRPKNIFGGFASAVKCVGAGFVAGGVALFAAPAVGYRENGLKGLAGGIVQGVLGGAAMAAAGVVAGSAQVVRGIANTPEAISQGMLKSNMKWDGELGKWVSNTVICPTISFLFTIAERCKILFVSQIVLRDLVAAAEEEAKAGLLLCFVCF